MPNIAYISHIVTNAFILLILLKGILSKGGAKVFKGDKRYNEIKEKLELAIDDILIEYQTNYDLSGDIGPLQALELDNAIDKTTEIIQSVLQFEFDFFRG